MPQPTKPTHLKSISGSRQPDVPVVALPVIAVPPPAPDWLPNAYAVKEWDRLVPTLVANGLLTEGGLSTLGHLCALHGKLVQLWVAGECPTGALLAQHRNLINDFAMTPVAQTKISMTEQRPGGNRFTKNGKRPEV